MLVRYAAIVIVLLAVSACAPQPDSAPTLDPPTLAPVASSTVTASVTVTLTPTSAATPTITPLPDRISDGRGVEMIYVPAGEFIMGSDTGFPDEVPVHQVDLDAFYIDKLETTNKEYKACMDAGACRPPVRLDCCTDTQLVLWVTYFGDPKFDDYPVIYLDWHRASDYCAWRGARLPTEAEWEKAARGPDGRVYAWGSDQPRPGLLNFAWSPGEFDQRALPGTAAVGSYPDGASPYGVLDMLGNVYEWVEDRYDPRYYAVSPDRNPTGPTEGNYRIARGGSFFNTAFRNRAANRNNAFLPADLAHFDAGARCAMNAP